MGWSLLRGRSHQGADRPDRSSTGKATVNLRAGPRVVSARASRGFSARWSGAPTADQHSLATHTAAQGSSGVGAHDTTVPHPRDLAQPFPGCGSVMPRTAVQAVLTGTASATVRPPATLPLIVPSSWTPPSSPKTLSEARLTRARFVTLWL